MSVEFSPRLGAPYWYKALVTQVHDGDTVTVTIDLGFKHEWRDVKIRMLGINAPEIVGATKAAGVRSRDELRALVFNQRVWIHSHMDHADKYGGRWLGEIWTLAGVNVNKYMLDNGFAVPFME